MRDSLSVRCVGSSTLMGHGLHAQPMSSVAMLHEGNPFLLVASGGGVVRSCVSRVGALPSTVFLPSTKLSCMCDLQVLIQAEALHHRRVKVYATGDVLDRAVAILDETIVSEVRDFVEFLQVEPGVPTSIDEKYCLLVQPANITTSFTANGSGSYNMLLMDVSQRPLLAWLEGPLTVNGDIDAFRAATCFILNLWPGFRLDVFNHSIANSPARIVVVGYASEQPPTDITQNTIALRPGDSFPVSSVMIHSPGPDHGWVSRAPAAAPTSSPAPGGRGRADGLDMYPTTHYDPTAAPQDNRMSNGGGGGGGYPSHRGMHPPRGSGALAPAPRGVPAAERYQKQMSSGGPRSGSAGSNRRTASLGPTLTRGGSGGSRGSLFALPPSQPRKLYVFNNESPESEPVIVMVVPRMNMDALKSKISQLLKLRPMGQLYSVERGLVRSTDELEHCQEIVATKHAGAPFDLDRLPRYLRSSQPEYQPTEDIHPMVEATYY